MVLNGDRMKKIILFLSCLLTGPLWAAGPASLTVSSGTFLAVDGFTNTNGNFRQAATIGDAVGQQTIKVDASSSAYINLQEVGGSAISASNPVPVQSTGTTAVSGTFWQTTQPVSVATPYQVFVSSYGTYGSTVAAVVINSPTVNANLNSGVNTIGTVNAVQSGNWNIGITTVSQSGTWTVGVTGSSVTIYSPNNNTTPIPVTATLSSGAQSIVVNTSTQTVGYGTGLSSVPVNVLNTVNIAGSVTSTPGPIEVVSSSGGYINVGWQTSNGSVPVVLQGITTSVPLPVQSTGTTAVSGTFWQTTQPVSGTVGVTGSSVTIYSPNNNTTAIPVSGTFYQGTQPVSVATPYQVYVSSYGVNGSSIAAFQGGAPWSVSQSGNWNVGVTTVSTSNQDFVMDISSFNHSLINNTTNPLPVQDTGTVTVYGNLADNGAAAATNRIATTPTIYQQTYLNGTAATQGRNGALSQGTDGLLWTAQLPAMRPASYSASTGTITSVASATDISMICGNATNTVLLYSIRMSCTQTTAGVIAISIMKRSTADTLNAASTMTAVAQDSNYSTAYSSVTYWQTSNPTSLGTLVGPIDTADIGCMATGTASPNDIYVSPSDWKMKPIVLRGTGQCVAVNLGGNTVTGGSFAVTYDWMEVTTLTP